MTKNQIIKETRKWAKILCCNEIDLRIVFKKFSKKEEIRYGTYETVAMTESNPYYMESTIFFNTSQLKLANRETIIHELLHIKLSELSGYLYANMEKQKADNWREYFEERFVSQMAKIISRLNG